MALTSVTVRRGLLLLEVDEHGQPTVVAEDARVAIAVCLRCATRRRVLPCEVLPGKQYSLPVIARLVREYARGDRSLRQVAWSQLGNRTPAHTTLHGWSEGLGAHVLERPGATLDGVPFGRVLADAESRDPGVAAIRLADQPVDERRFRSAGRRERLSAMAMCLAVAALVLVGSEPDPLVQLRRLSLLWSGLCPLGFPSRFSCTPIEQGPRRPAARSRATQRRGPDRCPTRTRSPPGATNRSRRS